MRYMNLKSRSRPRCRVDSKRPMRQAMTVTERESKRLGTAVQTVRERLDVTQEEFAVLCGLSLMTIQRVELGKVKPRAKTFGGLDKGAGWPEGTARSILAGGPIPSTANEPEPTPEHDEDAELREMVQTLQQVVEDMQRRLGERDKRDRSNRTKGA